MADKISKEQRHFTMAAIHSKDTKPEMIVRRYLWHHGFRYRLNHPRLPGKPDIVLLKYRTCIFVNGCFWHGHHVSVEHIESTDCCRLPSTNRKFWEKKILRNMERDKIVQKKIEELGWHCITIWECDLVPQKRNSTLMSLEFTLNSIFLHDREVVRPYVIPEESRLLAAEEQI